MKLLTHLLRPSRDRSCSRRHFALERLIVFTRYPEPERTKTRLIPALGADGAVRVYREMTEHALGRIRQLRRDRPVSIEIRHAGGDESLMREWLGPDLSYVPQGAGDLGERMARVFHETLKTGVDRAVLVGTDCPGITGGLLREAFETLKHSDVVLGPASDGGYYLIGLRLSIAELFLDIPWGTEKVLERTRRVAEGLGLSVRLLETLHDVDRPEDLPVWEETPRDEPASSPSPRISIIIPTLNEAENIAKTLASTRGAADVEVILVDGGSSDQTVEMARSRGAEVIISPAGRARQMNAGAAIAKGEVLLFLHGDSRLPRRFDHYVYQILARAGTVAGAFELRIDGNRAGLRFIEQTASWRSRLFGLPYGDQAIFLGAGLFRSVGGFPEMPLMEDLELMRRLRRLGRVVIAPVPVVTSDRRWETLGVWRTTVTNYAIPLAYSMGVSPSRLVRWYGERRRKF